jgi:tetratricopeptide (TPR) repeat protein
MTQGRWVAVASLVLGAAACAPARGAAYEQAFAAGARAEGAGRFSEAAAAYDQATAAAVRTRDREQARWDAAEMVARTDDLAQALARLDAIAAAGGEHAAEAAYHAADLRITRGDAAAGWAAMAQIPRRYPQHGVAHAAVRRLVGHADESGPDAPRAAREVLDALERDLGSTEVGPLVSYLDAEHVEASGDDEGARAAYIRIADRWPYPFGAFFDDALWRASLLDDKLGRPQAAVDDLERLVKERETTSIVGTYERAKYVPAMLRIGELWRDRLHDRAKARAAYHRLYADFANSTSRDDALWLEAALWRDDGDGARACDRLGTLIHEFPDSRYVPCSIKECTGLERPPRSRAPRECHPYIERSGRAPVAPAGELEGSGRAPLERAQSPSGSSSSSASSSSSSRSSSSSSSTSSSSSSKSAASSSPGSSGSALLRFSNLRSTPASPSCVSRSSSSSSVSSPDHSSSRSVKNSKKSPLSRRRSISSTCSSLNASRMSSRSVSVSPSSIASCADRRI